MPSCHRSFSFPKLTSSQPVSHIRLCNWLRGLPCSTPTTLVTPRILYCLCALTKCLNSALVALYRNVCSDLIISKAINASDTKPQAVYKNIGIVQNVKSAINSCTRHLANVQSIPWHVLTFPDFTDKQSPCRWIYVQLVLVLSACCTLHTRCCAKIFSVFFGCSHLLKIIYIFGTCVSCLVRDVIYFTGFKVVVRRSTARNGESDGNFTVLEGWSPCICLWTRKTQRFVVVNKTSKHNLCAYLYLGQHSVVSNVLYLCLKLYSIVSKHL